jgi:hypothetical protein
VKKIQILLCLLFSLSSSSGQNRIYDSIILQLQIVERDDQSSRIQLDSIREQFANDSSLLITHLKPLWNIMRVKDSIDLLKVNSIIGKYGWLGPDDIGDDANSTLFIVIQHADLKTQEKYLPLMREAVKKGKASAKSLALLEDRVALREHKKQIYGTQVYMNIKTNECFVLPLEDPYNVDKRRKSVGLQPLSNYLEVNYKIKWDVEKYEKDLPTIEAIFKSNPF